MLRKNSQLPHENVNIVFNAGGLGDALCRVVAVKYVFETYKHCTFHLWVHDYFLELAKHLLPKSGRLRIYSVDEKHKYNKAYPAKVTDNDYHSNLSCHLVDHGYHTIADQMVGPEHKNYLPLKLDQINISKFPLPEKYVVITSLFTAKVREMLPEAVNGVAAYCISKGYTPVFLGKKKTHAGVGVDVIEGKGGDGVDYSVGLDLRDQTTLLEAGKIIAGSKAIVGLDNGLLHLAGCTETSIVAGFTTVKPEHRLPYRHNELGWNCYPVVPEESLGCRFCQSNFQFIYDLDFRNCYYQEKKLDTEIQCVKALTSELFIQQLEKIL